MGAAIARVDSLRCATSLFGSQATAEGATVTGMVRSREFFRRVERNDMNGAMIDALAECLSPATYNLGSPYLDSRGRRSVVYGCPLTFRWSRTRACHPAGAPRRVGSGPWRCRAYHRRAGSGQDTADAGAG